jgi:hypothetical protein
MKKNKILLGGAAILIISIFVTSVPVSSTDFPGFFVPFAPEDGDWITYYSLAFEPGYFSEYEGKTLVYRYGVSKGDSDIIPMTDFGYFAFWPISGYVEIPVDSSGPMHYSVYFIPFFVAAFPEKGNVWMEDVYTLNPNNEIWLGFGMIDLGLEESPHEKYADVNVCFQHKVAGEDWTDDWIVCDKSATKNCNAYFVDMMILGFYYIDFDYNTIYDWEGYLFGGTYRKSYAVNGK